MKAIVIVVLLAITNASGAERETYAFEDISGIVKLLSFFEQQLGWEIQLSHFNLGEAFVIAKQDKKALLHFGGGSSPTKFEISIDDEPTAVKSKLERVLVRFPDGSISDTKIAYSLLLPHDKRVKLDIKWLGNKGAYTAIITREKNSPSWRLSKFTFDRSPPNPKKNK